MPGVAETRIDTGSLEEARVQIAGAVGPTEGAYEGMTLVSPVAFGQLAAGPGLIGAIADAVKRLDVDLRFAARHLGGTSAALQGAIDAHQADDAGGAGSFGAPAPGGA